jgi:hypothetical protein
MPVLDIAVRQCLIDFYEDEGGFFWHHRVLLIKGDGLQWIWLTPDGEVQRGSLAEHRVVPLRRGGVYPPNCAAEGVYGFDPLAPGELDGYMADARALAVLLGFPGVGDAEPGAPVALRWFVSDNLSEAFGFELPPDAVANPNVFIRRGDVALTEINGQWTTAKSITPPDTWEKHLVRVSDGRGRDPRLLGDVRDHDGIRFLPFREALIRSRAADLPGFPLKGPRAAPELLLAIRDSGQASYDEHCTTWIRKSGVPERSSAAREHRCISIALRLLMTFDQIDAANSAAGEFLSRRMMQIEAATRRNPRQPDFEGLDGILDVALDEGGSAILPKFTEWIGKQQQSEASVLKAGRMWREEQTSIRKAGGGKDKKGAGKGAADDS